MLVIIITTVIPPPPIQPTISTRYKLYSNDNEKTSNKAPPIYIFFQGKKRKYGGKQGQQFVLKIIFFCLQKNRVACVCCCVAQPISRKRVGETDVMNDTQSNKTKGFLLDHKRNWNFLSSPLFRLVGRYCLNNSSYWNDHHQQLEHCRCIRPHITVPFGCDKTQRVY